MHEEDWDGGGCGRVGGRDGGVLLFYYSALIPVFSANFGYSSWLMTESEHSKNTTEGPGQEERKR